MPPTQRAALAAVLSLLPACGFDDAGSLVLSTPGDEVAADQSLANTTFLAQADAEAQSASPTTSFGTGLEFGADQSPVRQGFVRFNVSNVPGAITRATLRCYVVNGSPDGPQIFSTSSAWSESALTWNNRPATVGAALMDLGAVAVNAWLDVDVSSAVKTNGAFAFTFVATSADAVACASRESGAQAPQLVVTYETTLHLAATADSEVRSATPTTNYGTSAEFGADGDPVRHAYVRFDVANVVAPIKKATFRCFVVNGTTDGPRMFLVPSTWSEKTLTYNNRPLASGAALVDLGSVSLGSWLAIDVTAAVKGNGAYSFLLEPTSLDALGCSSREAASNRPELLIELGVASTPDAGSTLDAGSAVDAGSVVDAGAAVDAGKVIDAGAVVDAGNAADAGNVVDAGTVVDAGSAVDAGASVTVGAVLPHSWNLSTLSGVVFYVGGPGASDSNAGTVTLPLATVAAALNKTAALTPTTIVVRGGTYREGQLTVPMNKQARIVAYPGELVTFTGAESFASGWTAEGTLSFHAYVAQPVNFGSGLFDSSGFADPAAQYPDQLWVGAQALKQVLSKAEVVNGKFFVDAANGRIYMTTADKDSGPVEASKLPWFIRIQGNPTVLEGLRISRFSNSLGDYGVVRIEDASTKTSPLSNCALRHVEILDSAMQAVQASSATWGGSAPVYPEDIVKDVTFDHVTIERSNWMGISATLVDGLFIRFTKITTSNMFNEFNYAPQSGALKTCRVRGAVLEDSVFENNHSHGLWFDQSNYDMTIARVKSRNNLGTQLFWEISDRLLVIDSFFQSPVGGANAIKIAGSSGVSLVNNTIVGGKDVIGVYTDSRSKPGCADPSQPLCAGSFSSDRDDYRPRIATIDWMPRIDLMLNNLVMNPTEAGYCGGAVTMCVTTKNSTATVTVESILHLADSARGIPATRLDGNVYVNGASAIVNSGGANYLAVTDFAAALATTPYFLGTQESAGKSGASWGSGSGPSSLLVSKNSEAAAIPVDARLNAYLAAGTRRYGVVTP